jgi:hypothetical protein
MRAEALDRLEAAYDQLLVRPCVTKAIIDVVQVDLTRCGRTQAIKTALADQRGPPVINTISRPTSTSPARRILWQACRAP